MWNVCTNLPSDFCQKSYYLCILQNFQHFNIAIWESVKCWLTDTLISRHFRPKTLQHWCRESEGPNCLDILTRVPKCLKDSSDLSTKPSRNILVVCCLYHFNKDIAYIYIFIG